MLQDNLALTNAMKDAFGIGCKDCKQVRIDYTQCAKNKPYELLKTGMVGGPSIVFCQFTEVEVSEIRSHKYHDAKTCGNVIGFDASSLYLYCSGQECLAVRKNMLK